VPDKSEENRPDAEEILEHISQCVITTDLDGVVTYWNRASEEIFGYSKKEMINSSLKKIYPRVAENQFLEDLHRLKKGEKIQGQWKSITKEGTIVWVDVHARPLVDDEGQPTAIISTAHNIQDLKRVEKELEESKAQAQAILETTVDGIITIDEYGNILSFNKAATKIFGYSEEEVLGKNVKSLMPDPYQKEHDEYMRRYRETGKRKIIGSRRELTGKRKDDSLFPMELSVSEVKWDGNRIFTGVVNDISERRRLEKEILRISEEERRSLGQDLHDGLGQMLTGIGLISQNLARKLKSNGIPGADEVQEISDLIKEADEYAKSLAHGLVHVDIEEEGLQAALNQLSTQAEKFLKVNCSFHADPDVTLESPMQALNLYRIAQEAVSNAVKHGQANNIRISLTVENGSIKLSIMDDGIGFTGSPKGKKKQGMGINIMKYRTNIMSGHLEISETRDKQTQVICSIPHNNQQS
jgi:PAS domain S-box-containing protein